MKINSLSSLPQSGIKQTKPESKKEHCTNSIQCEVCSKEAASSIATLNMCKIHRIPDVGEIPKSVIKKCTTGEKGPIINKETGEKVDIRANIRSADGCVEDYKILSVYDKDKEIGHVTFKHATKDNPCIISAEKYLGDDGAIYIDYMQNNFKDKYSHVGTFMHRVLHELSKQQGSKGKMILDSMSKPAAFHYDSGFIPLASFNADNDYFKAVSQMMELQIMTGHFDRSTPMCLDENKMKQLENGEHCIPKEMKNIARAELYRRMDELREIQDNSDPWD